MILYLYQLEADAAYRLAAALSNYDKDELKNLHFINIEVKSETLKDHKNDKNFIQSNKKQITDSMGGEANQSIKNSPASTARRLTASKR